MANKTADSKKYHQEYAKTHRQQIRKSRRDWLRHIREEVIEQYGGVCACCAERLYELLRVIPGPSADKPPGGTSIYLWLRKSGYPPGYLVFCAGCAQSKTLLGYCPHEDGTI